MVQRKLIVVDAGQMSEEQTRRFYKKLSGYLYESIHRKKIKSDTSDNQPDVVNPTENSVEKSPSPFH